jgi:hypothetical protein
VHGFYPFLLSLNPFIKINYYEKSDHTEFIQYLSNKLKALDLVPSSMHQSLELYIQSSLIYSFRNFIIAKDAENKIVGCCYALSSSLLQDYFPQAYNDQAHNFRQFLKLASLFKIGRKLTKPFSRTQKDQTLNFQFLHFLFFEHPEVLKSMLYFAYEKSKQNEFLVYTYEQNIFQYRPPSCSIHSETPHALYEIRTPDSLDNTEKKSLKQKIKNNIWLDGFLF